MTLNATTSDGRTSSVKLQLLVEAHDVAAVGLKAPSSARAGQSTTLTLQLTSLSAESVNIYWEKSYPGSYYWSPFSTDYGVSIPQTRRNSFSMRRTYHFTPDDATNRQVQFRVRIEMQANCRPAGCCFSESRFDNNVVLALTDVSA